ncbi:MAG: archease [Atribacterota bacterium]|nr:archease [Atribacterota bacterium]MDD4895953.1 archease [Atribacterota bacterium]MDD5636568.1 archease [Atribacterota bacterium]
MNTDKDFELVDHTADIGLKIYGKNKQELFLNAARGMFFLITSVPVSPVQNRPKNYYKIESSASNIEDLMITWLSDLLYIHVTEFVIFDDYIINSMTEEMIKSKASAIEIKSSPYRIVKEIKAVTYHDLSVYQDPDGRWTANIVFDI